MIAFLAGSDFTDLCMNVPHTHARFLGAMNRSRPPTNSPLYWLIAALFMIAGASLLGQCALG